QAWAAGSVFMLLQAALGVEIDAPERRLTVRDPLMPRGVARLDVTGLHFDGAPFDLHFADRDGSTVVEAFDAPRGLLFSGAVRPFSPDRGWRSRRSA
ncbi:MAG TPA: hypothetical protein VEC14_15155, partial [Reyranellaceae bacterium]|nr:hypothetical protein [Reyranellaceae bacterium]